MKLLCNPIHTFPYKPFPSISLHSSRSPFFHSKRALLPQPIITTAATSTTRNCRRGVIKSSASSEIDMVQNKQGIYTPKQKKVVILWDLDNKPPRGPPYQAAMALKQLAQRFGEVVDASAYANRHAFVHLPQWVIEERRERKQLDILERKGVVTPPDPYVCGVCGRKCKTNLDLKKHFKQLHERERQKKLNRMGSLKGKKRQRFKERFVSGNHKYNEAARSLMKPKVGYGLASELRRAGVFVKTVEDKPQAADWALKRQMQHSMSRGIDWLFLVSDDSDFSDMLRKAREAKLGTVVVGDMDRALGRHADVWVPWIGVENGEVSEKDLVPRRRISEFFDGDEEENGDGLFSDFGFDGGSGLDNVVDELVRSSQSGGLRISAFSEGELEGGDWVEDDSDSEEYLLDSENEDSDEEDGFF
ncbi:hypothetical protein TB2_043149 [Malus domestica]|uniref:C2H2-type domain-containing protein n=1 Tax=Malus domestica TaxID=3750 RepID=A0A498JC34_MALDO|nr:uncharacterized protein LOC103421127 [Malus domestica]RXH91664.1 hypothetical protein DVH24_020687 [Malus domestica]